MHPKCFVTARASNLTARASNLKAHRFFSVAVLYGCQQQLRVGLLLRGLSSIQIIIIQCWFLGAIAAQRPDPVR